MAIEGPTPVSSLLHSSTIVVAGVILSIALGRSLVLRVSAVIIVSLFLPAWFDGKKIIALSTSVHLVVMFLAVSCGLYGVCLIHILTHAFVKASCFVASGIKIGMNGNQELRLWSIDNQTMVMIISFLLLCRIGGSIIYSSKEIIVLQIVMFLIVLLGWKYTKTFFHRISRSSNSLMKINYSVIMMIVLGRTRFGGVEYILALIILGGLMPVFNS